MSISVLVCDDQMLVREVLSEFLKRKGFDVTKASCGKECIELARSKHFDTIFLDINMPQINGIAVMREIASFDKATQVILMSGVDRSHYQDDGFDLKDATFLAKPFSLEHVLRVLKASSAPKIKKVLIVDDQDMLRGMLKDFLETEGYEIVEARNGQECISQTQGQQFGAIFMDVRMPVMDGLEALKELRNRGVESPVFLMSGFSDIGSLEDAQSRGAQHFLPKPFKLESALAVLEPKQTVY